jgi:hypothetical protein
MDQNFYKLKYPNCSHSYWKLKTREYRSSNIASNVKINYAYLCLVSQTIGHNS